jgi:luciferase family oxidoreductase group 1
MSKTFSNLSLSVLDLVPIVDGGTAEQSFRNTLELARHAEQWGYKRYWLAEHHGMPGIASSATALVIGYVASGTKSIRVGSGGIMLPNHAPLMVAEQFGTLESLYPGRIDLGLGRAPGSDFPTTRALRRGLASSGDDFPELLDELRSYLKPVDESNASKVRAIPGEGLNIPIWLLGSSDFSAQLAASLGLPFAFASHFAPDFVLQAIDLYRTGFRPSEECDAPYVMIGLNVIAADSDEEAAWLATSMEQQFLNIIRGRPGRLQPPTENMDSRWTEPEKTIVRQQLRYSIIGGPKTVRNRLLHFQEETGADEFIIASHIYDHRARMRSYEILAEVVNS